MSLQLVDQVQTELKVPVALVEKFKLAIPSHKVTKFFSFLVELEVAQMVGLILTPMKITTEEMA